MPHPNGLFKDKTARTGKTLHPKALLAARPPTLNRENATLRTISEDDDTEDNESYIDKEERHYAMLHELNPIITNRVNDLCARTGGNCWWTTCQHGCMFCVGCKRSKCYTEHIGRAAGDQVRASHPDINYLLPSRSEGKNRDSDEQRYAVAMAKDRRLRERLDSIRPDKQQLRLVREQREWILSDNESDGRNSQWKREWPLLLPNRNPIPRTSQLGLARSDDSSD